MDCQSVLPHRPKTDGWPIRPTIPPSRSNPGSSHDFKGIPSPGTSAVNLVPRPSLSVWKLVAQCTPRSFQTQEALSYVNALAPPGLVQLGV